MSGLMNTIFTFAAAEWMPWLLSATIVIAALLLWMSFSRRAAALSHALDGAIGTISEVDGQTAFKNRFPVIFQKLAENPVIGETWRSYAATLNSASGNEEAIGYTRRPKEAFNEGLIAAAGINLRFYGSIPNFLVSAGLLFSFLGLVAALHFASAGVAARNVAEAQSALGDLLEAATFKFATSITGLGASLVFSWREKAGLYQLQRRMQRLCALLEARMRPVTTESLLAAQLAEMRQANQQIRRLSQSVFIRVPQTVEERLAEQLDQPIERLRQAVRQAAGNLETWSQTLPDLAALPGPSAGSSPIPAAGNSPNQEQHQVEPVSTAHTPSSVADPLPPDSRSKELRRLLDHRLAWIAELLGDGIDRLQGSRSMRRRHGEMIDLLQQTHDRIRDSRNSLNALLEHEATGSGALRRALGTLDGELRATRKALREATATLDEER
ncbi:MAG: hypothetical protein H6851_09125 [Geminicoccaceae bacterium]|nr:hypothetical protein [Geminicoccaceae bacterium]